MVCAGAPRRPDRSATYIPAALILAAAFAGAAVAQTHSSFDKSSGGSGQAYPAKPIRVITAEPGGGNDFAARTVGLAVAPRLGQPWVVDNRGGAGGLIAFEIAARAPADGYTLLVYAGNIWTIPLLRSN